MPFTPTPYNRDVSSFVDGQVAYASPIASNYQGIENTVDALNTEAVLNAYSRGSIERNSYIKFFDDTAVSTGTNSISIASNAVRLYNFAGDNEITGWGASGSIDVSAISGDGIVWAIYPGLTYTATNDTPASKPANAYRCLRFVNTAGVVTVQAKSWISAIEAEDRQFEEDVVIDKTLEVKGNTTLGGNLSVGGSFSIAGGSSGSRSGLRQAILQGKVNTSTNAAEYLSVGTGLKPTLLATTTPFTATLAAGFSAGLEVDYNKNYTSDQAWAADLPVNQLNYLYLDRDGSDVWTLNNTIVPPQNSTAFDAARNSLLHFEGSDTSTTMTDDYGNTWTAAGNAQIDTAQFKFGAASLLLDGTGDYISSTVFTNLGALNGRWSFDFWHRSSTLPTAGNRQTFVDAFNSSNFGVKLEILNTAGTYTLRTYLSSNGTSADIASDGASSAITIVTGTWYHIAIVADGATYRVYFNGTQVYSVASALKIAPVTTIRLGANNAAAQGVNGWIDEFRFSDNCCRFPAGTTYTPAVAAYTPDANWFDQQTMTAKEGSPTAWTAKNRLFIGTATTTSSVTAVSSNGINRLATINDELLAVGGNGHGATATKIRNYVYIKKYTGSSFTYTMDSTNGLVITIAKAGQYAVSRAEYYSVGLTYAGVSLNSVALTTNFSALSDLERVSGAVGTNNCTLSSWAKISLQPGDRIRPHSEGAGDSGINSVIYFQIVRIGD